jgi:hypothetical protein|tara:strand:+ start:740 stop:1081 length:342 start_codon:yes stop_codon:yes gene_type:complete
MENNTLTIVLITILSVGTLSTLVYLVSAVRNLKDRVQTLASEMVDFHTEYDNHQVQIERLFDNREKEMDIRTDRIYRKMDKIKDDIHTKLPTQIRKTIEHIEFARPLDNTFTK